MAFFEADEVALIRAHRFDTTGYILADAPGCLSIQAEEVHRVRGRRLVPLRSKALPPRAQLPKSWIMAVVLCPGDATAALAAWARALPLADLGRIRFYEVEGVDAGPAYAGWIQGGLPALVLRFPVRDTPEFIRLFGRHLNQRIVRDHRS